MNSRYFRIIMGSVIYALIANCSSQIDSTPNPVISSQSVNAGGVYFGTLATQGASQNTNVTALFDSTQHLVIFANDASSLQSGLYSLVNTGITGQARIFSLTTTATPGTETFNASFQSQSAISAQYTANDGTTGLINLNYQAAIYEQPSATKLLAGNWGVQDNYGQSTTQFAIAGDGTFNGTSSTPNCSYYNGQISTINLQYNVYRVTVTESCTTAGANVIQSLTGLASIFPANTQTLTPQQLVIALASTTEGRLFLLTPNS